jgi:hypothetical protein
MGYMLNKKQFGQRAQYVESDEFRRGEPSHDQPIAVREYRSAKNATTKARKKENQSAVARGRKPGTTYYSKNHPDADLLRTRPFNNPQDYNN